MSPPPSPLVQAANIASKILAGLYGFLLGALNLFAGPNYSEIPTTSWKCDSQGGGRGSYNRRFISAGLGRMVGHAAHYRRRDYCVAC